jgi:hypothetical protein
MLAAMATTATTDRPRLAPLAVIIAAILVAIGALVGFFAWNAQEVNRGDMDRAVTFGLKSTLLALDAARDSPRIMKKPFAAPNKLDDSGKPLSSWRFQITPYLEFESKFHADLEADWQAPVNYRARARTPHSYCFLGDEQPGATTNVFAITGPGAALDPDREPTEEKLPDSLIVLMETAEGTHWMEPGDYDVVELLAGRGVLGDAASGLRPDRIHVAFADAEVWALSADTPMQRVQPFLTIDGAKTASRAALRDYRLPMNPTHTH